MLNGRETRKTVSYQNRESSRFTSEKQVIERERDKLMTHVYDVSASMENALERLGKCKSELFVAIARIDQVRCEVDQDKIDIKKTMDALLDIDRQLLYSKDLASCEQCVEALEAEKGIFGEKHQQMRKVPTRINQELDATLIGLQRQLKEIRSQMTVHRPITAVQRRTLGEKPPLYRQPNYKPPTKAGTKQTAKLTIKPPPQITTDFEDDLPHSCCRHGGASQANMSTLAVFGSTNRLASHSHMIKGSTHSLLGVDVWGKTPSCHNSTPAQVPFY